MIARRANVVVAVVAEMTMKSSVDRRNRTTADVAGHCQRQSSVEYGVKGVGQAFARHSRGM